MVHVELGGKENSVTSSLTGKKTGVFEIASERGREKLKDRWPVEVNMFLCIANLNDISTVHHSFSLQGKLRLEWKASDEEAKRFFDNPHSFCPDIIPRWEFRNQIEFNEEVMGYENGTPYDFYKVKGEWFMQRGAEFNVTFAQCLDLRNFPFDSQNLKIVIESRHLDKNHIQFKPMVSFPVVAFDQSNNNVPDWQVHGIMADFDPEGEDNSFSQLVYSISVSRNFKAVLIRLVSFLVGIPIMAFTTFSMSPSENVPDRLAHAMTCLLTEVAFQFVINNTLPDIPYVTWLDEVCIASFLTICIVLLQSSILPAMAEIYEPDDATLRKIDVYCLFILIGLFILGAVYYTIMAFIAVKSEEYKKLQSPREELEQRDDMSRTNLKWMDSKKQLQGAFLDPVLNSDFLDKAEHSGAISRKAAKTSKRSAS